MIGEENPNEIETTSENIESFQRYLETESKIFLFPDDNYDVVRHFTGGSFKIIERTEDFSRARAIADFHTSGRDNTQTIIYDPYGNPIYMG